ncbi:MAG: insulinase family protein [Gammaproteobacteria bacterium]|nr:insulinase family protein [Gammaproteobacteria bacterium]
MTTFKRIAAYLTLTTFTVALAGCAFFAQEERVDPTATKITSVEGVTEYRLNNGLSVLLLPDPSEENIYVNITYKVGSADENYGEVGMAHLLEHMVFKGTTTRSGAQMMDETSENAISANGSTWLDRTNYYVTVVAQEDKFRWALEHEADRMTNSLIEEEELEKERYVVANEWDIGENPPSQVLSKRIRSIAMDWHNYANSTIGARADIVNVTREQLYNFYRKYYQPDTATLIVAGKFDEADALDLILDVFGSIPKPDRTGAMKIYDNYSYEQPQDGERTVVLERIGDTQIFRAAYRIPSVSSADHAALSALSNVLSGSGVNSRLYKNLVETKIATTAYAYPESFKYPGFFWVSASVALDGSLELAESEVFATIEEVKENPPTEEELSRFKVGVENYYTNISNTVIGIAQQLSEWSARGDWRLFFISRDRAEKVTVDDVQRVAQEYLIPANRSKGYFKPVDDVPPRVAIGENPDISSLVNNYEGRETVSRGEFFEATPVNIAKRTEYRTMSNGARVAMLAKENTGDTVSINATMRWGTLDTVMNKRYIANFTSGMIGRGTVNKTRNELSDEFRRLRLGGGADIDLTTGDLTINTVRENLEESIRLVAEIARQPSFDETEFELLKKNRITGLEAQRSEPSPLAGRKLSQHLNQYPKGHPNYVSTIDEDIEGYLDVTLEQIQEYYTSVAGLSDSTTITVVGDFDPDEVFGWLEEYFGDWISPAPYERIGRDAQAQEAQFFEVNTPDKTNALMLAAYDFPFTDEDPDYEPLLVAFEIFGGGFLNSRLATRIRQKEGLSYSVRAGFSSHPIDKRGYTWAQASVDPENMDKLVKAFKEEVSRAVKDGFTEEEVTLAKNSIIDGRKGWRSSDGAISTMLHYTMFFKRNLSHYQEVDDRIAEVTLEDVNRAFRKHVSVEKFTIVTAGDLEKETATEPMGE